MLSPEDNWKLGIQYIIIKGQFVAQNDCTIEEQVILSCKKAWCEAF